MASRMAVIVSCSLYTGTSTDSVVVLGSSGVRIRRREGVGLIMRMEVRSPAGAGTLSSPRAHSQAAVRKAECKAGSFTGLRCPTHDRAPFGRHRRHDPPVRPILRIDRGVFQLIRRVGFWHDILRDG